jgi:hypothetical protein
MEYPRVTSILRPFVTFHNVSEKQLEKAAQRGSSVHALCSGIAKGVWCPTDMVPEELKGYVDSFKQWADKTVDKYLEIEKRYFEKELEYTGEVDFIIRGKDGLLYLVDLKTSAKPYQTYPIQMAAYNRLLNSHEIYVHGAMLVYLSKTGEYPKEQIIENMEQETRVFLGALECYKYFNKGKLNG